MTQQIPNPLAGVTELRVHGVSNTPPSAMLDDPFPRQVGGDRVAGFYRTSDRDGRHREAYSWGGLTSGARSRALWVVMLPAMLANIAGWSVRPRGPVEADAEPDHAVSPLFAACARLAALALSVTTAASVSYLLVDLIAARWLVSGCSGVGEGPCLFEEWSSLRVALGTAAVVALALVVGMLARSSRSRYEKAVPSEPVVAAAGETAPLGTSASSSLAGGLSDSGFWSAHRYHRQLTTAHLTVGLAVVTIVAAVVAPDGGGSGFVRWAAVGAGVAGMLACVLVALPGEVRWLAGLVQLGTWGGIGVTLFVLFCRGLGSGFLGTDGAPGSAADVTGWAWCAGLALAGPLLVQQGWAFWRHRVAGDYFTGSAPIALTLLAQVALQLVLLAIVSLVGKWVVGDERDVLVDLAFTTVRTLVVLWLVGLAAFGTWFLVSTWWQNVEVDELVAELRTEYGTDPAPAPVADRPFWRSALGSEGDPPYPADVAWALGIARFRRIAKVSRLLAPFLAIMGWVTAACLAAGTALTHPLLREGAAAAWWAERSVHADGLLALIALLLPAWTLALLALLWRSPNLRRIVGVAFDVGTCLPRAYHPFAPPCYGDRAVPELEERVRRLVANEGRVVLVAHSQGSVLSAFVLLRPSLEAEVTKVALVSYGSPLSTLYRWAFPTVFTPQVFERLVDALVPTGTGAQPRWRNLFYATDYVGGPVRLASGAGETVNRELKDPPTHWHVIGEPPPGILTHTGYHEDPALRGEVDSIVGRLPT